MANPVTEREKEVIRALQCDLPLVPEPYRVLAEQIGITEEEFLETVNQLKEKGCLKRISIALHHKNVGFLINVMVVWNVPDAFVSEVGAQMSSHSAVTHCYNRSRKPGFPYNFYTMVHCQTETEYEEIMSELREIAAGIVPEEIKYEELRTVRELKKVGMKYFMEQPEEIVDNRMED
ncbi:MAG: Lrp/AsnC family transcriptional regulator [Eubacteriales bacterium]|nr:Lrp/AsnC family transcriptional regulator [Eubacteriales bacterium]